MTARTTRRELFGASAALLLLATRAAGAGKAAELDGELLDACARFHAAQLVRDTASGLSDDEWEAKDDEWTEALGAVCALRPRTPEGLQARAGVAATAMRWSVKVMVTQPWEDQAEPWDWLAIDVLSDIMGRADA